jgi:hypothetical protein
MLKQRIRERLEALDLNAFEAARTGGLERSFINDILSGRKSNIHTRNYIKLATVLRCTPEYLRGEIDFPGEAEKPEEFSTETLAFGLPISGLIDPGAFRRRAEPRNNIAPMSADPRFIAARQMVYEVRESATKHSVFRNTKTFLGSVDYEQYVKNYGPLQNNDLVIVETRLEAGSDVIETSCREVIYISGELCLITRFCGGVRNKSSMTSLNTIVAVVCRYVQIRA